MKTSLLIATCFLTVIILQLIPYRTTLGDTITIYSDGVLPNLFTFLIICIFLLFASIALTQFKFKQPLQGQLIIKRKDLNLGQQFSGIAFWAAFVVTSQLLAKGYLYFFKGTAPYFFIILAAFLVYELFTKRLVRHNRPDFLSIDSDFVYVKSLFSKGKRKIENLKSIRYDTKQNSILLTFQEGLDNIKLYLTDYEISDIHSLVNKIKRTKGDTMFIEESFNKYFTSNN
ncbi:MAG: hypothetical protein IPI88_19060 [Chitinophagaceae bacterium]|nr:hypothetical protein [Chitinophagaceae bacterium]